ncbi:MAG TPA: galactose mutarotase [Candidatus Gallacutalibacter stercoravium]|nr:galactose mutarotase [Candidatus Gallacutalibacter stercoravium]
MTGGKNVSVQKTVFGRLPDGRQADLITLSNGRIEAQISNYGGIIYQLCVPDKAGKKANLILGHDGLEGYLVKGDYHGALIGRYANRIAKGRFTIDGKDYQITQNEGETALHGGVTGLNQKLWDIVELKDGEEPSLTLACFSPDGEEGFPGNLRVQVVYTVTANDGLRIEYFAQSDKKTPINLTNHAYFNLKGDPAQDILDNLLCIHADAYTPIDADSIPTGELAPVQGTPMDFTSPKPIGRDICADFAQLKKPMGYDHNYVLNASKEELPCIAEVQDPQSGRRMRVYTDQPGVQLYTANFLDGSEMGKNGVPLQQHHALCLETQNFPDSVHQPGFPDPFYGPGRDYHYTTIYQFDIG